MSQVSIIDIEGKNPQIPTRFNANIGFAIPIGNVLNIYGSTAAAGVTPVFTTGAGNTVTVNVQIAQAIAATNATNVGLAAFNAAQFTVDANGFVSISGAAMSTSFVTDNGTAIPAVGILNVNGGFTNENNANGLTVIANPDTSNNVLIELTNRLRGTGSTVGAVTTDLVTFALGATPGTYVIDANFCAFESTTPAGAGYSLFGSVRTTGAAASLVGTPDKINNENTALIACNADIVVSGNNMILRVTGTAGLTINWIVVATYTKVT